MHESQEADTRSHHAKPLKSAGDERRSSRHEGTCRSMAINPGRCDETAMAHSSCIEDTNAKEKGSKVIELEKRCAELQKSLSCTKMKYEKLSKRFKNEAVDEKVGHHHS